MKVGQAASLYLVLSILSSAVMVGAARKQLKSLERQSCKLIVSSFMKEGQAALSPLVLLSLVILVDVIKRITKPIASHIEYKTKIIKKPIVI